MPDEHNVFDLSGYNPLTDTSRWTARGDTNFDMSGRPAPVNVRVQLDSGVVVNCDCRYQGINPNDGDRLFMVIAEIDWENYHPRVLIAEECPDDVEFRFRVPGMPDDECDAIARQLQFVVERIVRVK